MTSGVDLRGELICLRDNYWHCQCRQWIGPFDGVVDENHVHCQPDNQPLVDNGHNVTERLTISVASEFYYLVRLPVIQHFYTNLNLFYYALLRPNEVKTETKTCRHFFYNEFKAWVERMKIFLQIVRSPFERILCRFDISSLFHFFRPGVLGLSQRGGFAILNFYIFKLYKLELTLFIYLSYFLYGVHSTVCRGLGGLFCRNYSVAPALLSL